MIGRGPGPGPNWSRFHQKSIYISQSLPIWVQYCPDGSNIAPPSQDVGLAPHEDPGVTCPVILDIYMNIYKLLGHGSGIHPSWAKSQK